MTDGRVNRLDGLPVYDVSRMTPGQLSRLNDTIAAANAAVIIIREAFTSRDSESIQGAVLPSDLEENYRLLFEAALRTPRSVAPNADAAVEKARGLPVTRLTTSQTETRGGAKAGKKSGKSGDPIQNHSALVFKSKIDRKLRKISREIKAWLEGKEAILDVRRCSVCRQYGDSEWLYCPKDGKPMVSESTRRKDDEGR